MRLLRPLSDLTRALLAAVDKVEWGEWPVLAAVARPRGKARTYLLYLHSCLDAASDEEVEAALLHEATHLVCGHLRRGYNAEAAREQGGTELDQSLRAQAWGMASDCAVHYQAGFELVVARLDTLAKRHYGDGAKSVTFERSDIPPMPAELAYEEFLKRYRGQAAEALKHLRSCGRDQFLRQQGLTDELCPEHAFVLGRLYDKYAREHGGQGAGHRQDSSRSLIADLPPPPDFVHEVIRRMVNWVEGVRMLSWYREHRHLPGVLPGRTTRKRYPSALFMVDASGSISDEQQRQMFGATANTPELAGSRVRIFSDKVSEEMPVSAVDQIRQEIARHGGGTYIRHAAAVVEDERCVVWLTDCASADGLPAAKEDWTWVIWQDGAEPVVAEAPHC